MNAGPWIIAAVGIGAAVLFGVLVEPATSSSVDSPIDSGPPPLPRLKPFPRLPVQPAPGRAVPTDILKTAHETAAPWAPGLTLERVEMEGVWSARRALIQDNSTKDVRAYAIGDLLPHGSLLVGISTTAVDLMVADAELVRLDLQGVIVSIFDFRDADAGQALKVARPPHDEFRDAVLAAVEGLADSDPAYAQEAIDALLEAGEPVVEVLLEFVGDETSVADVDFVFGGQPARVGRPLHRGAAIMVILETTTSQHFGDPLNANPEALRLQARQWERWAGR